MKAMIDDGCRQSKKRLSKIWLALTGRQVQILILGHGIPALSKILLLRKCVARENDNLGQYLLLQTDQNTNLLILESKPLQFFKSKPSHIFLSTKLNTLRMDAMSCPSFSQLNFHGYWQNNDSIVNT
jgi:hypothetical protein